MIYGDISLYIMYIYELLQRVRVAVDFVLQSLHPFFTVPTSILYNPYIQVLQSLHPFDGVFYPFDTFGFLVGRN